MIGGSLPYIGNIFLYESLFELRIIKQCLDLGVEIKNVYDCFYFRPEDEDTVFKVINDVAMAFNNKISKK